MRKRFFAVKIFPILLISLAMFVFSPEKSSAALEKCACYCGLTDSLVGVVTQMEDDETACMNYCKGKGYDRYNINYDDFIGLSSDIRPVPGSTNACAGTFASPTQTNPPAATGSVAAPTTTATFENPLEFNTAEEFLTHFLTYIQRIIVILALVAMVVGALFYITSGGESGRIETAKSTITSAMIGLAIAIAAPSFLKEISVIMGWKDNPNSAVVSSALTLTQIATNVLTFLLSIIGVLSIIMMVLGGTMYVTSAGDEDGIDSAKGIVKYSVIGVIVALSSMILLKQIARLLS